jgi:DNA-binding transcriptional LysR family regulator
MHANRLPLHAMRTFAVAARHLNFVKAAKELFVTHGAVSHQIRMLEEQFGAALFDRQTRPIRLTPAGEQLLAVVNDCLLRLQRAATAIEGGEIEGELTLSCVPGVAANWLVPNLGRFVAMHSNIAVHVVTEHWQRPVLSADRSDLAIIYGAAAHPGKRVVLLGQAEFFPVCSARLIETAGPIETPADIPAHTLLHEYNDETWSRWFAMVGIDDVEIARRIYFDGAHLSLEAARAGYGIAMGDMATVRDDLASGTLVRLFDAAVPAVYPYYLTAARRSDQSAAARALEEWLLAEFPVAPPSRPALDDGR